MCDLTGRGRSEAELGRLAVGRVSVIRTRIFLNMIIPSQSDIFGRNLKTKSRWLVLI